MRNKYEERRLRGLKTRHQHAVRDAAPHESDLILSDRKAAKDPARIGTIWGMDGLS